MVNGDKMPLAINYSTATFSILPILLFNVCLSFVQREELSELSDRSNWTHSFHSIGFHAVEDLNMPLVPVFLDMNMPLLFYALMIMVVK